MSNIDKVVLAINNIINDIAWQEEDEKSNLSVVNRREEEAHTEDLPNDDEEVEHDRGDDGEVPIGRN